MVPQLAHQAPFRRAERLAKDAVPGIPHEFEQCSHIPLGHGLISQQPILAHKLGSLSLGFFSIDAFHLAIDKRTNSGLEQFQCFADAFVICDSHGLFLVSFKHRGLSGA